MFVGDSSSSSQSAQHRRRVADDERQRAERAVQQRTVGEEGAVTRQAGEAPAQGEVERFRTLMQQRRDAEPKPGTTPRGDAAHADAARTRPELAPPTAFGIAERFRDLLQRAFDPLGSRHDEPPAPHGDDAAPSARAAPAHAERGAGEDTPARPDDGAAAHAADVATADATPSLPQPRERALRAGDASGDAGGDDETPSLHRGGAEHGDAQSANALARKAAEGETQAGVAARIAQAGRDSGRDDDDRDLAAAATASGDATAAPASFAPASPMPPALPASTPQAPPQAAASFAPALSELIEKHVRQMLVSDPRQSRGRSREVLLRMGGDVLPGTDLWLTRTDQGWQLRADVGSRDAYETLLANQDELVRRFADGRLGELSIEPVYHGDTSMPGDAGAARARAALRNG
ncbi:MAG TPA: type III secretion HpaP family protein [Dokdonella sp.]